MARQQASIVDVAKLAGVSVASASRVLSNSSYPVSPDTQRKVLAAAKELNYVPNFLARNLRAQRSNLVAVLVGDNADPYFAEITRGVEEVVNASGYLTIICNTDRDPSRELNYLRILQDYRVDGVIFAAGALDDPGYTGQLEKAVQSMMARGTTVIALSQHTLQIPSVQADNLGGARAMTRHLIELGHRRIAFVMGPPNITVANARLDGYRAAVAEAGIPLDPTLLLPGNFDRQGGEQAAKIIAEMPAQQRPGAIFAANDETAFGLLGAFHRLGWQVPRDISICGFGDLPMAEDMAPALTTVHIGLRELGRTGARRLLAQFTNEQFPYLEVVPTTIIERETTSRPRDSFDSSR